MTVLNEYKSKLRTADEAVRVVKSGDWVDYSLGSVQPVVLDDALAKRKGELRDVKIRSGLSLTPRQVMEKDPEQESFTFCSWHLSGYDRVMHDKGQCYFTPMVYRNKPLYYRDGLKVDVAMITVTPMDKHGFFNFGIINSTTKAMLEQAKVIIVEVNEALPYACGGYEESIHISEVDYIVEAGNIPVTTIPNTQPDEIDETVAKLIVEDIRSGSTLQLGIGGMPNAVGNMIAKSDVKDLSMHTEMLVDAYLLLYKEGKLTNKYKNTDPGKGVWSFCVGSKELYDWVDHNPFLASFPVNYTNNPAIIASIDNFISVNNCLEVDLFGQVSSESIGTRQISGTGGQLDFVLGAYESRGGASYICFRSMAEDKKTGAKKSRVVPVLPEGEIVTVPRSQIHYLVTEYGKVNLAGLSVWERAEKIISIAHPEFRVELVKEAETLGIWRRSNRIR